MNKNDIASGVVAGLFRFYILWPLALIGAPVVLFMLVVAFVNVASLGVGATLGVVFGLIGFAGLAWLAHTLTGRN